MKKTKNKTIKILILIQILSLSIFANNELVKTKIEKLVQNGSVVLNSENGERLLSINADQSLVPASIIKVLTSQIAMDLLGKDYRFETEFFTNKNSDLLIKGHGDPFLISDEIRIIAKNLKENGINSINKILLDHSYFKTDLTIPGVSKTNDPYNALNGATVVNFNTINIKKSSNGVIISGEPETPLTPLAIKKGATIGAGRKQRINLSDNIADCHRYAGELFTVIFREKGITVNDINIGSAKSDASWMLVYTHKNSRDITEVLKGLLRYSNNYIANQIFLEIGAKKIGTPATLEKGKIVFEKYIRDNLKLSSQELRMVEGAGISRSNSVTGNVMVGIMEKFKPNANLLSIKKGHLLKSGTLTGIYNYAGYIKTAKGLRAFSIMLNQKLNYRDSILKLLTQY